MMLELWRPHSFDGFRSIENQMNRMLTDFFGSTSPKAAAWLPAVDVVETKDGFELRADLPGLKSSDVSVQVEKGLLTIRGQRKDEHEKKGATYHSYERRYGSFVRSFELPGLVDESAVKAKYADGVLTVTLPKREEAKPKSIEVKVE
ncbi:MAG TPA: Hsp20/alpha crystallin family protein [Polyangia bacterium]|nr:Hsp20/alpha crystallin family protein [Polyangia bacterium]